MTGKEIRYHNNMIKKLQTNEEKTMQKNDYGKKNNNYNNNNNYNQNENF